MQAKFSCQTEDLLGGRQPDTWQNKQHDIGLTPGKHKQQDMHGEGKVVEASPCARQTPGPA